MKRLMLITTAALVLAGCSGPAPVPPQASARMASETGGFPAPSTVGILAGEYRLDPEHASLTFKVNHMGFSHYTARFSRFTATLKLDPSHPEMANLTARVDPQSLELNAPPKGMHDDLMGKAWFDVKAHPSITFTSTKIEKTGDSTAKVTGNLTLHGVTQPVTLNVAYNGGYPGMELDPHARIGFTATGSFKRSDFGMGLGIAPPGSHMGVSDAVDFNIDAEFVGPKFSGPASGTPASPAVKAQS